MFKDSIHEYSVKSCPTTEPEELEELLNSMAVEGWELFTIHEAESRKGGMQYNCIFFREYEEPDEDSEIVAVSDFKSKMEKMMNSSDDRYEECKEIQRSINDKQQRIAKIKNMLDSTSGSINREKLNQEMASLIKEIQTLKNELFDVISPDNMYEKIAQEKLTILISEELIDLINSGKNASLIAETVKIRQNLTDELGYVIPAVKFKETEGLEANEYAIDVRGIKIFSGRVHPGYLMYYYDQLNITRKPKNTLEDIDSVTGQKILWIEESKTRNFWEKGLTPAQVIAKNLEHASIKYVNEILDYNDVNRYIEIAGSSNLFLIENVIPNFISITELRSLFVSLLRERVPLKDIVYVFERLNDLSQQDDKDDLSEKFRLAVSRYICNAIADKNKNIYAVKLSDKLVKSLQKANWNYKSIPAKKLVKQLLQTINEHSISTSNLTVISPVYAREKMFNLLNQYIAEIYVLSSEELCDEFNIELIADINE